MGRKKYLDPPKAFIDKSTTALEQLEEMLDHQGELYNKCISTIGFAYGFSQLANRAIHFDWLVENGIIPKDYPDFPAAGDKNG